MTQCTDGGPVTWNAHPAQVWMSTQLLDSLDRDKDIVAGALTHEVSHVLAQHQVR